LTPKTIASDWFQRRSAETRNDRPPHQLDRHRRLTEPIRVAVKIRSRAEEAPATLAKNEGGSVLVTFDEAQRAVTPGQRRSFTMAISLSAADGSSNLLITIN